MTGSIQPLFLLPLAVQFTALALIALIYRNRGYRHHRQPKANIFRCSQCRHLYLDNRRVPLSACPVCHTLNEVIRR